MLVLSRVISPTTVLKNPIITLKASSPPSNNAFSPDDLYDQSMKQRERCEKALRKAKTQDARLKAVEEWLSTLRTTMADYQARSKLDQYKLNSDTRQRLGILKCSVQIHIDAMERLKVVFGEHKPSKDKACRTRELGEAWLAAYPEGRGKRLSHCSITIVQDVEDIARQKKQRATTW